MNEFFNPTEKHFISPEEREELERTLGHMGLVVASLDEPTNPHYEDNQWVVRSNN